MRAARALLGSSFESPARNATRAAGAENRTTFMAGVEARGVRACPRRWALAGIKRLGRGPFPASLRKPSRNPIVTPPIEVAVLVAEPRSLLKTLNATCTRALERAAGACLTARHYEVTVEHMLLALLDDLESDVPRILEHFEIQPDRMRATLQRYVGDLRLGPSGRTLWAVERIGSRV